VKRSAVPTVVLVIAAALVALLVYGVVQRGANTTLDDAVKSGKHPTAPGAQRRLPLLEGAGDKSLAGYRGKVVVLNFWASWCEPCRAEAPLLERAQRALASDDAGTVLGATYNDTPGSSKSFVDEFNLTYPSVRDVGTKLAREFGTRALPETFVLDAGGRIVAISRGQVGAAFLDRAVAKARATMPSS
jgi:cytochrome c biogenesis protein CcmG/thiol:disulfide interchange protein DsbE